VDQLLAWVRDASPYLLYVVLGVGAAIENIFPPIPADTFVLLGGFLAARGLASERVVFFVTWTSNALSALLVFAAAYRYGDSFFQTRLGRYVLDPKQVGIVRRFYRRWGVLAIFYTRFLPGLRSVAPVFAGLVRQHPLSVVLPLVLASGIWYGGLVWIGAFAGRNVDQLLGIQSRLNWILTGVAGVIVVLLAWWWVRSRRRHKAENGPESRSGQDRDESDGPSE
jgi:membrane protein DedA with SNARE-associated domain